MAHHWVFARPLHSDFPWEGQRWHWLIRFLFKWWLTMQQITITSRYFWPIKKQSDPNLCKVWVGMCQILLGQTHSLASGVKHNQRKCVTVLGPQHLLEKMTCSSAATCASVHQKVCVFLCLCLLHSCLLPLETREIRLNQNKLMNYHKIEANFNWMADRIEQQEDKSCVLQNVLRCFCLKNYRIVWVTLWYRYS